MVALTSTYGHAGAGDVVLWNKLGSSTEVQSSEIGAGGQIIGANNAYEAAQFGNGYIRKAGDSWLEFPPTVLDGLRERGTIALWIVPKVANPVPFQYGFFGLVGMTNAPYPSERGRVWLVWGDGVTGRGFVAGVNFGDTVNGSISAMTPNEPSQFVATPGTPIHAAVVWDIDGIAGTSDRVRVYRDNVVVGQTTAAWITDGTRQQPIYLGIAPDAGGYDKFITDNLVVYDYAKTDFSDRFLENPVPGPEPAALTITRAQLHFAKDQGSRDAKGQRAMQELCLPCTGMRRDCVYLAGRLDLSENSDGIDLLWEEVIFEAGIHSVEIPAGAFKWSNKWGGGYRYNAPYATGAVCLQFKEVTSGPDAGSWTFSGGFTGVDNSGTSNPMPMGLTIGDDAGETAVDLDGILKYVAP
jgi:hypothetical protein